MSRCKGYAASKAKAPLAPHEFERREPREHDLVIDIKYCGICHSGIHQTRNEWSDDPEECIFAMVPGHESGGVVSAIGNNVTTYKVGDKVGVGCYVDSCRTCPECRHGLEQYCTVGTIWTYNGRDKEGTPAYGGYSDRIVVDQNYVLRMPENLPLDACAPLLCAGITLYSPPQHWEAGSGRKSPS
jgi:alcohol dehydrogenase (NADP+)